MRHGIGLGIPHSHQPWTPKRLGSALGGWWRADMGITLVGGVVSAWADQSGNGHHLVQSTASRRPAYSASHADWNGMPALTFDGVLSALATTDAISCGAFDIWVVCKVTVGAVLVSWGAVAEYIYPNPIVVERGGVSVKTPSPVAWMTLAPLKKTVRWRHNQTDASHKLSTNGTDVSLANAGPNDNPVGTIARALTIFNGIDLYPTAGTCPEVVLVTRHLDNVEAARMLAYTKGRYAHF